MTPADSFLLGVDLVKDGELLQRAYDDAAGVTARFNKNVLAVVDRTLDADFDLDAWAHEARWVPEHARIEMHLRARGPQRVHVRALSLEAAFADGETILTEISRKFTRETVESTLHEGGMYLQRFFDEPGARAFGLALARLK